LYPSSTKSWVDKLTHG